MPSQALIDFLNFSDDSDGILPDFDYYWNNPVACFQDIFDAKPCYFSVKVGSEEIDQPHPVFFEEKCISIKYWEIATKRTFPNLSLVLVRDCFEEMFAALNHKKCLGGRIISTPSGGKTIFFFLIKRFVAEAKARGTELLLLTRSNFWKSEFLLFTAEDCLPLDSVDDAWSYMIREDVVFLLDTDFSITFKTMRAKCFLFTNPEKEGRNDFSNWFPCEIPLPSWSCDEAFA